MNDLPRISRNSARQITGDDVAFDLERQRIKEDDLSQAQLDKAMADHADSIDDSKIRRADGTIDGSKLIDEMFGR